MNNPHKLSRLDILFGFFLTLRASTPLLFIIYVNIPDAKKIFSIWGLLGFIVVIGISIFFAWLPWKKFSFYLDKDRIVIMRGVFNREEKIIYYNRIHSVNVQQPLIHRIFGVAKLKIETPGGKIGKAEGELRALPLAQALELQQQLKHYATIIKEGGYISPSAVEDDPEKQTDSANLYYKSKEQYDYTYKLSASELFRASLTSLNLNYAIIFILGIYSFADDFIRFIVPEFQYYKLFSNYDGLPFLSIVIVTVVVLLSVWLLSIVLYLIKFGDYHITRSKEQLSITYGLLEKKSYIFNQHKVQAIIMEENPLRQLLGYVELKVQVITSDANKEQLVIHPYLRKKQIVEVLEQLMPNRILAIQKMIHKAPAAAFRTYALWPMIIVTVICGTGIWFWHESGLWMLLLYPVVAAWSHLRRVSAGIWLEEDELILRKRIINRTTYFVARKHIVSLKVKASPRQRRLGMLTISVQVLGSMLPYTILSLSRSHVEQVWNWYSRSK